MACLYVNKVAKRRSHQRAQVTSPITIPPVPPDDKAAVNAVLERLEQERQHPAIVYWTTALAKISVGAELPLYDQLRTLGRQKTIDLVLFTNGGDTEAPWRLISVLREFCDTLAVLVPHRALSAGTVLALGADEIVMTPLSALGPIDPSRTHPLLPRREGAKEAEPISVQDMRHAMQFIKEAADSGDQAGTPYTPDALAKIFTALFDKIHPLAIGAIEQSYALAKLIGKRCLETHMTGADAEGKIDCIVDALCDDYKSHAYQISRREAREIGLKIHDASPTVDAILMDLLTLYTARLLGPFGTSTQPGAKALMQIAWIDSKEQKFRCEQQVAFAENNNLEKGGDRWVIY